MSPRDKVRQGSRRFRSRVPALMNEYAGQWVVFLDDEVKSAHDSEEAAYVRAVKDFGLRAGFVIAKVEKVEPEPLLTRPFSWT